MRFAIPVSNGRLDAHFGHCQNFALIDVDEKTKAVLATEEIPAPPHQPGLLPVWLGERGVNVVIAGGMGQRALELFSQQGITVVVGTAQELPGTLVNNYLAGRLTSGANLCDH